MTLEWSETCSGVHRDAKVVLDACNNFQMACGKLLETREFCALVGPTTIALVLLHDLVEVRAVPGRSLLSTGMAVVQMTTLHGPGTTWVRLATCGVSGLNPVAPGWSHDFSHVTRWEEALGGRPICSRMSLGVSLDAEETWGWLESIWTGPGFSGNSGVSTVALGACRLLPRVFRLLSVPSGGQERHGTALGVPGADLRVFWALGNSRSRSRAPVGSGVPWEYSGACPGLSMTKRRHAVMLGGPGRLITISGVSGVVLVTSWAAGRPRSCLGSREMTGVLRLSSAVGLILSKLKGVFSVPQEG